MLWIDFPDERLAVHGLAWFIENAPQLWRLPKYMMDRVPPVVASRARCPSGGRIRFTSNTSQLHIRMRAAGAERRSADIIWRGLDLFVDGTYWRSISAGESMQDHTLFTGSHGRSKNITVYLPVYDEIEIMAIAVDGDARIGPAPAFAQPLPLVLYGSSVVHGSGAGRPSVTYPALVGQRANLDFINLGFGGAGRAEPVVVDLVRQCRACCYVLDLGKSYDFQPREIYLEMLGRIRAAHPTTPIISITPIYSSWELYCDSAFRTVSEHTRAVIAEATRIFQRQDNNLHLIEGPDLIGPDDMIAFYEGVHPNVLGNLRIAEALTTVLERALGKKEGNP